MKGNTAVVIGSQWGDEGKGKITNYLSERSNVVVRYQGGDNAGHTIAFGGKTYKLHLLPSGIFHSHIKNVLGNGMVINPKSLLIEMQTMKELGFTCANIFISDRAHVIFDYNIQMDVLSEEALGANKIGTTKKGIGPTYTDKISRLGIRMADFVGNTFKEKYYLAAGLKNKQIQAMGGTPIDIDQTYEEYQALAKQMKPYVCDTITLLNEEIELGKKVLFEGAQGALLDIDFGSYPFVTSSNPSAGGVTIGTGVGPTKIQEIIGIVKAYTTRVGSGPFPTEFENELSQDIRERAHEYGTTTKRPRRIGWLDAVMLKYSARINGLTGISLMLLDILSGMDTLKIATSYTVDGQSVQTIPARLEDYEKCVANYIELPGWKEDISQVKSYFQLPKNARKYIETIEQLVGVEVKFISVGPDKEQTIIKKEIF